MTNWSARKAAQRAVPTMKRCEHCETTTERLQRHHPDLAKPVDVIVLCQPCHTGEHLRTGTWGSGPRPAKVCPICGSTFTDYSHSRVKTCGRECLSEMGRRNAAKRWGPPGALTGKTG